MSNYNHKMIRAAQSASSRGDKIVGVITFWNVEQGFGFVHRSDGKADVFVPRRLGCRRCSKAERRRPRDLGTRHRSAHRSAGSEVCHAARRLAPEQYSREHEPRCREYRDEQTELRRTLRFIPGDRAIQRALRHLQTTHMHDQAKSHHENCEGRRRHENRRTFPITKRIYVGNPITDRGSFEYCECLSDHRRHCDCPYD